MRPRRRGNSTAYAVGKRVDALGAYYCRIGLGDQRYSTPSTGRFLRLIFAFPLTHTFYAPLSVAYHM